MPTCRVSVLIPTYNRAALVGGAIDSVLTQTRMPDEIIVVDDGSTDQTADVLARYGPPVRVIRQDHAGVSTARNTGLAAVTGDVVAFLDDDDRLAPASIERRAAVLEAQSEIALVYTDVRLVTPDGERLDRLSERYPVEPAAGIVLAELALHNFITLSSVMARTKVGGQPILRFDETLSCVEDFDLWLRLASHYRFAYLDEPLTDYCTGARDNSLLHWGLVCRTYIQNRRQMQENEITVQARVFEMRAFRSLTRTQQARVYCSHGVKQARIENWPAARRWFIQAVRTAPAYPAGYVLTLLSLLGPAAFNAAILARRWMARFLSHYV